MIISEENIKRLIEHYEAIFKKIDDMYGDDFDACEASGGNFDDAYQLGYEHGQVSGTLSILYQLLKV